MNSKFFDLNKNDFAKGLILAIIVAGLNFIYPLFKAGNYHVDWGLLAQLEITTVVGYLTKNLVTNQNGQIGK